MKKIVILLLCCCLSTAYAVNLQRTPKLEAYIQQLVQEHAFSQAYLDGLFKQVEFKDRIIELMNKPYESKPWYIYRKHFIGQKRIQDGLQFWLKHQATLKRAEEKYGVPASVIVAILGVESSYGKRQGSFRVMDALSTLAFHYPKRAKFFTKELTHFLIFTREEGIDPMSVKGSYAGAMGQGQFMPSSYRHYAVDFSGNGGKDIINSPVDAIGSVANYLKENGWQAKQPIASHAKVKGEAYKQLEQTRKPKYQLANLNRYGVIAKQHFAKNTKALFMKLKGKTGPEYWVGFHNFYVITRYNTSRLYALAVYQLSEKIASAYQQASKESFDGKA